MLFNLIHRPIGGEKRSIFQMQQDMAHTLGLKVTLLVQYELMFEKEIVEEIIAYHNVYGDEIGIWFSDMASEKMNETICCKEPFLWLYSKEDKQKMINIVVNKFHHAFGFWPTTVGAYHMDAYSMQHIKEVCPSVKISLAGCFEEGVKVFHGCNNSWYLFNEGMPWNPWYPSVKNTLCPADSEEDWTGVVAVPHLSRDLALSFEGRNDFFASHPANVQRAMANEGKTIPYVFNLLDLYRMQEPYNDGFSYTNMFVGPGWLQGNPNVQDTDEITQAIYLDYLTYIKELKSSGDLTDMYLSEFAEWYVEHIPIHHTDVYWAKEILYGSKKHYFWINNESMRVVLDACQGGSIGDLRPFVARQERCTGADTPFREIGSNPYIIHSQYRSGNSFHYADGARTTFLLTYGKQMVDLCDYPVSVLAIHQDENNCVSVQFTPAKIKFDDGLEVAISTLYKFTQSGEIYIERVIESEVKLVEELRFEEYVKGCYGTTEYPEDMTDIVLKTKGVNEESIVYAYKSRSIESTQPIEVNVEIPKINTKISLVPITGDFTLAQAVEGYLFNPFFTVSLSGKIVLGEKVSVCLKMRKSQ